MRGICSELVAAVAQQRGSVPLGLAADIEVFLGGELSAAAIAPEVLALEQPLMHDLVEVECAGVARRRLAFLDDGDSQSIDRKWIRCYAAVSSLAWYHDVGVV